MNQYGAILLDPPWKFKTWTSHLWQNARDAGRSPESHYPTLPQIALKSLLLQPLMAKDCAVFMFSTWPTLPDALELGAAWGLEYKTCAFCWAKTNKSKANQFSMFGLIEDKWNWHMGMGYWTRANTEPCLLFTKGSPKRKAKDVRQLVIDAVREHSRKPDCIYDRIEALVDGPYLECFARHKHTGWDSWGNEIESDIEIGVNVES